MRSEKTKKAIGISLLIFLQCLILVGCGPKEEVGVTETTDVAATLESAEAVESTEASEAEERASQKVIRREEQLQLLVDEQYDSVMMSMWGVPFAEDTKEWIDYYRTMDLYICQETVDSLEEMDDYIEASLGSGQDVYTVMLMLDPVKIWTDIGSDSDVDAELNKLVSIIIDNEGAVFEIMLPWFAQVAMAQLTEEEMNGAIEVVQELVELTASCENIRYFFLQDQDWLVGNPGNYVEGNNSEINESVYKTIMLYTYLTVGDGRYEYSGEELADHYRFGLENIQERLTATSCSDLSDMTIMILGDSIVGSFRDSLGVCGVIEALSGARTINCAIGGTSALEAIESELNVILDGDIPEEEDYSQYEDARRASDENLLILLEFGINDYFEASPLGAGVDETDPGTYTGAINVMIESLQERYPGAKFGLLAPGMISMSDWGMEHNPEGNILEDYREACKALASGRGIPCIDTAEDIGINMENIQQYIWDEIHFSVSGRYYLGIKLIEWIDSVVG